MTRPRAYYNELDPRAAATLRELIRHNHIAPGEVDERSIEQVQPSDLVGFTQCHFFAGFGVWSYALRLAGWPDDRPIWTGSCPCPPFSSAGKKKPCPECGHCNPVPHVGRTGYFVCIDCGGSWFADGRHLWPELWRLVAVGRPATLLGEQVASGDGRIWLASVRASLEILGYAVGGTDTCAAGVGAPHIRQRIYFAASDPRRMGDARSWRREMALFDARGIGPTDRLGETNRIGGASVTGDAARVMGDAEGGGRGVVRDEAFPRNVGHVDGAIETRDGALGDAGGARRERDGLQSLSGGGEGSDSIGGVAGSSTVGGMADADGDRRDQTGRGQSAPGNDGTVGNGRPRGMGDAEREGLQGRGAEYGLFEGRREIETRGPRALCFWDDCEWIPCRDGKARPVEPGTFPLVNGAKERVGRLRGYGNAIVAQNAEAFVRSYVEAVDDVAAAAGI